MAYQDVYQIKLTGEYLGRQTLNVFNYIWDVGNSAGNSLTWADTFLDDVMPSILPMINDLAHFSLLETINWRDPSDFDTQAIDFTGEQDTTSNNPLAAWLTLLFRYNRNHPGQNHGFKRFAGGTEAQFNGDSYTGSNTERDALSAALAAPLTAPAGREAHPFVVATYTTPPPALGSNPSGYVPTSVIFRGLGTQKSRRT